MKFLTEPTIYDAYVLSWVSMVCTILAFFAGLAISVITGSAATLGYSLENAVDTFSSALVLWRFWGGGTTVPEKELELREKVNHNSKSLILKLTYALCCFVKNKACIDRHRNGLYYFGDSGWKCGKHASCPRTRTNRLKPSRRDIVAKAILVYRLAN